MRVLSGIQPTGELHIGNWLGAVQNWVRLQDDYECLYVIVDYHAVTLPYDPAEMPRMVEDMLVSLLAAGLDPDRCRIFLQSEIPEHAELAWILTTLAPLGQLERMTQFKDKAGAQREAVHAGLLMYPVLQAADILLYKADRVPVGEDQVQHLELARTLARRFNNAFGETFPEPQPLLTETRRVAGLDGKAKMSKSRGNHIGILEEPDSIRAKLATAFTDPQRKRRSDPGRPWMCNVFTWHGFFSDPSVVERVDRDCRVADVGCHEDKMMLADILIETLRPMRERAAELRRHPDELRRILEEGREAASTVAAATMAQVRAGMGLWQASIRVPTA